MFISILLNSLLVIIFKVATILPKLAATSAKESHVDEVLFSIYNIICHFQTC